MSLRHLKILTSLFIGLAIVYFLIPKQSNQPILKSVESKTLIQADASYIKEQILSKRSKITLVNVWASWCTPCKEEMPALVKLKQSYESNGLSLVLISADKIEEKETVEKLLQDFKVDFPTFIRGEQEISFISDLSPSWQGGIPASFIYNEKGEIIDHWQGSLPYEALEKKVLHFLKVNNS